ncbi:hypothetical protein ACQKP1_07660 [Allorhizobium sp. NPDC080224]|uniref:hypothetical protein n=1 Tax=Allorhizobium sp. NPDC080224 TaxID=3390547 RepID=UPI003D066D83
MDWKKLEAATDLAVLGAFSELVRHAPMTSSGTIDSTRPAQDIQGVLHTPTPAGTINIGNGLTTTVSAAEAALVVNRADYPGIVFKAKDRIRGSELTGQPWWEVKTVNDRYSSVIILALNQA